MSNATATRKQLVRALSNRLCYSRAYAYDDPGASLLSIASELAPGWEPGEVHQMAHWIDGIGGPCWVLHITKGEDCITLFASHEFGIATAASGKRWPSCWS